VTKDATSESRCKTIEHGTEMSETTMDLMIKYNAYYIPTLQQEALWQKALILIIILP
jgi:imidazolonepropionase-like amidohydrolase